jgi:Protein of unknown function (DUF3108)
MLVLCATLSLGNAHAFEPFQAHYTFDIAGLLKGTATRTLTKQNDIWSYRFNAKIAFLANADEVSRFKVNQSENKMVDIRTLDHAYQFKIFNKRADNRFKVDWTNNIVSAHNKHGDSTYPAQEGLLDMLNLELQVREDIKRNKLKPYYLLADDKGITKIRFVKESVEKIQTDAGEYETLKFRLVQKNQKRKTYFWLAPKLDYLPVRVHQDDGNLSYELNMTKYQANP